MNNFYLIAFIAMLAGVLTAVQSQLMGFMDKNMGTFESVLITYGGGGLAIVLLFLLRGDLQLTGWQTVPWYAFTAGLCGLLIVGSLGYSVPRLGAVIAFTLFTCAQFVFALAVDHFGLLGADVRPLNLSRLAGVAILLLGTWLIVRQ